MKEEENEEKPHKYLQALFTTYGLSYIVSCYAYDICDTIEDKHPNLFKQKVKHLCRKLTGTKPTEGTLGEISNTAALVKSVQHGLSYLVDFGRVLSDSIKPDIDKLIYAMANEIGRYKVPDINLFAKIIVTQMLAADAADFARKHISVFEKYRVTYVDKEYRIHYILSKISTIATCHYLTLLENELLPRYLPKDFDVLNGDTISNGLDIIYNKINENKYWKQALNYAQSEANKVTPATS